MSYMKYMQLMSFKCLISNVKFMSKPIVHERTKSQNYDPQITYTPCGVTRAI